MDLQQSTSGAVPEDTKNKAVEILSLFLKKHSLYMCDQTVLNSHDQQEKLKAGEI